MTLDGFMMYLLSPNGAALDPAHMCVFQDMDQPLAHYFISSSHNTYLTDSQIGGPSSTEAYVRYCSGGGWGEHIWESSLEGYGVQLPLWASQGLPGSACPLPCSMSPTRHLAHHSVCPQGLCPGMSLCGAGLLGGAWRGARHLSRPHAHLQDPIPRCGPGCA